MANLLILESPAKANTIKGYLGSKYKVVASKGHVRDLPKSNFGIDIENDFAPHYINIRGKGDLIKSLKAEAKAADKIYLATDPDREGEAISWHLAQALGIPCDKAVRITFNEITKTAVKEAIKKPRQIDMNLVNAQQTRRILDRIVGYRVSPFFWKRVRSGLSAGRVQSAATKIIVDREEEIEAFVPSEYWTIEAELIASDSTPFTVKFFNKTGEKAKLELFSEKDCEEILKATDGRDFTVSAVKKGTRSRIPSPPFTTSTLQQEASKKLNFQSQRTMKVAQELYEGINLGSDGGVQGLITYMRTDSLRISNDAQNAAHDYIVKEFGESYYPDKPRVFKTKSTAQDAHEAIRPSSLEYTPAKIKKYLSSDQYRLYNLIWKRFIASQMANAEFATTNADFDCNGYTFKASGFSVKFEGYLAVYDDKDDSENDEKLPPLKDGETLKSNGVHGTQHFTEPPSRYTEASLIKFFEEMGIGRPSTYTPIITTILQRGYISRDGKSLVPTQLGRVTTKLMTEYFPDIVDSKFTADMETRLDGVEEGKVEMNAVLREFYDGFVTELDNAMASVGKDDIEIPVEETDIVCDKCGAKMIIKNGRYGKFAACPNYPTCKNTKPLEEKAKPEKKAPLVVADFKCELCGSDMVERSGKFGTFYACSQYPKCKFTKQKVNKLGVLCPDCGGEIVTKYGKKGSVFYSCEKYPDCTFSTWDMPTNEKCPECGKMLFVKKAKNQLVCKGEGCQYKRDNDTETN